MQNKHLKFLLIILVVAFVVPQITLAAWWNPFSWGFWNKIFHRQTPIVCTQEAKLCPDGSSVSRQGPKCEFKACPESECVSEGKVFGANDINLHCCNGLTFQPTTQSGTVGQCIKETDQTAGWKTYTNNIYNYQINYISIATTEETMGGGVKIKYQNGSIEICSTSVGACGNVPGVGPEAEHLSRQIIIGGKNYNISGFILNNNEFLALSLPNNMYSYINISGVQNSDIENKLLEMLSTFKFTK